MFQQKTTSVYGGGNIPSRTKCAAQRECRKIAMYCIWPVTDVAERQMIQLLNPASRTLESFLNLGFDLISELVHKGICHC